MQKWFDNNDILMYSTHNEGKSGISEKFIKMRANDSKSCFAYLNKLIDKYNNNYHRIIGKKAITAD